MILLSCLKHYKDLFCSNIGEWTKPLVDIPLKDKSNTYNARALPIPDICLEYFKKYLDILVTIGVMTKINRSEWAAPSFIIPKKYGWVRFISDFWWLNKQVKHTPYPLTHIKDMLNKQSNFTSDTTLYLIMGYYNILLTYGANKICMINT